MKFRISYNSGRGRKRKKEDKERGKGRRGEERKEQRRAVEGISSLVLLLMKP